MLLFSALQLFMEAICWCYYWGRISRTCTHVEDKVIWKFHRWSTSSVMRALWLHPVDAADRTVMVSPKSTYVEATSSCAVLKAGLLLYSIYIKILQGYIKYQLYDAYRCLYCEFVLFAAPVTTAIHKRGPPFYFDLPPTVFNPLIFVLLYSNFIHSDSSQEEEGGFGANATNVFFLVTFSFLPCSFHTNKKRHLKDLKVISLSPQQRPSLIEPDPECDRVIWFPSQPCRLIERRKSQRWFGSYLFIYVRSSPILRDQAMEWRSVDGSIVGGPHFVALRELECAAHGQAWTEWRCREVGGGVGCLL